MGRYLDANCRLCRREGMRLFLKGDRCYSKMCAFVRRPVPPGIQPKFRKKPTEYALQLREKQKVKRYYGVMERQFRRYYEKASRQKGITGIILLQLLERRLDNVLYRAGFAPSRKSARQLINHGHTLVNQKRVDIPSYLVNPGDVISLKEKIQKSSLVENAITGLENKKALNWLEVNPEKFTIYIKEIPAKSDMGLEIEIQEQLIVELYSK